MLDEQLEDRRGIRPARPDRVKEIAFRAQNLEQPRQPCRDVVQHRRRAGDPVAGQFLRQRRQPGIEFVEQDMTASEAMTHLREGRLDLRGNLLGVGEDTVHARRGTACSHGQSAKADCPA